MNINEMTHADIEARKAQIAIEMNDEGADIDALTEEVRKMNDRDQELRAAANKAAELRKMVAGGAGDPVRSFDKTPEKREFGVDSKEYRNAWLKNLQGKELTAEEQRAFTVANGATATITANAIVDVVRQHASLLDRVTLIYSDSKITYYVEGTNEAAEDHAENATITPKNDTLTPISLTPAEITKMVQVSDSASKMSVDVFEMWLSDHLGKAIARAINKKLIDAAMESAASAGATIDAPTVQALLGSVKGSDVALVCNNKTLFTKLLPLQDDGKNALVRFEGGSATVYGRPVLLDDNMVDDKLLAGDWSKMIAVIAEDVNVKRAYDIDTNSNKFLGVSVFDCKTGLASGFGKIAGE